VFDAFEERLERIIRHAVDSGNYDAGIETIRALKLVKETDNILYTNPATGARCRLVRLQRTDASERLPWPALLEIVGKHHKLRQMQLTENEEYGVVCAIPNKRVFDLETSRYVDSWTLYYPTGKERVVTHFSFGTPIDKPDWKERWQIALDGIPDYVETRFHVVAGAILDIWDKLDKNIPQIYRMQTTDTKESLIGRYISPFRVAEVIKLFDANLALDIDDVRAILEAGQTVRTRDGYLVLYARLHGQRRIRVLFPPNTYDSYVRGKNLGLVNERVRSESRWYLPNNDLARFLEQQPAIGMPA
jgi:hypothetical protein